MSSLLRGWLSGCHPRLLTAWAPSVGLVLGGHRKGEVPGHSGDEEHGVSRDWGDRNPGVLPLLSGPNLTHLS